MNARIPTLAAMLMFSIVATAQHTPYAGMQDRAISTLSDNDRETLQRGGGWGTALPAELNGYPGPTHLLELKDEIPLQADQVAAVRKIFDTMRAQAIEAGKRLIEVEQALDDAFASGGLTPSTLQERLEAAESARRQLRFVHLSAHLETVDILNANQIVRYNKLRGYDDDPSAEAVPAGHDPQRHRQHMGCE